MDLPLRTKIEHHRSSSPDTFPGVGQLVDSGLGTTKCVLCQQISHAIYSCVEFMEKSPAERQEVVCSRKLCYNCLLTSHMHHSSLHSDRQVNDSQYPPTSDAHANQQLSLDFVDTDDDGSQFVEMSARTSACNIILISTVMVKIADCQRRFHNCCGILDRAAQGNFMTEALSQKHLLHHSKKLLLCGTSSSNYCRRDVLNCGNWLPITPSFWMVFQWQT
ncbi:hypothetical protein PR048_006411, partial [Dryococelus australis]